MLKSINIFEKKHKNFKNRVLKMIFVAIEINLADFMWIYSKQIAISKFLRETLQRFLFVDFARSDFRVIFSKICL